MRDLARQLGSYGIVGAINTGLGFAVIAALTSAGFDPLLCNVAGYAAGLTTSYLLNRRFTFDARRKPGGKRAFVVSFAVAYLANLAALYLALPLTTHALLPQLLGMVVYNVVFFLLMRVWVFR